MIDDKVVIDDVRFYKWHNSYYLSVTAALKFSYPKDWYEAWVAKSMANAILEYPDRQWTMDELLEIVDLKRTTASDHGTAKHKQLELLSKDETIDHDALNAWQELYKPTFLYSECQVFNIKYGYAGTIDAIVEIGGKIYLMDLKTGNVRDASIKLQLAAYKNATFIGKNGEFIANLPKIDACAILSVPRKNENNWGMHEIIVGNKEWQTFLACLTVANFHIETRNLGILNRKIDA